MKKIILAITLLSIMQVSAKNETSNNIFVTISLTYETNLNAFCRLIQIGDVEPVKFLIEDGIDVNQKSTGLTPLMIAARHNRVEIVKLLIKNGAKLKVKSYREKRTALKWAELSGAKDSYILIKKAINEQKKKKITDV